VCVSLHSPRSFLTLRCADEVGPHSKLELYQLYFKAPGISYACNALSTTKKPDEIVELSIKVRPHEFISGLQVRLLAPIHSEKS
jgi:hypothetical protein